MRQTENKPCVAGALQSATCSKCHAQLEATFDIILVATPSLTDGGQKPRCSINATWADG